MNRKELRAGYISLVGEAPVAWKPRRYVWWCPLDGFVYDMLLKCGWHETSRVYVDGRIECKMEAPCPN